jgi:hypothetical protein
MSQPFCRRPRRLVTVLLASTRLSQGLTLGVYEPPLLDRLHDDLHRYTDKVCFLGGVFETISRRDLNDIVDVA